MAFITRALSYCFVASVGIGYTSAQAVSSYPPLPLPANVTSAYVDTTNTSGLVFHYLSAGCDSNNSKPLVLLLHGFPEMAYAFKDILVPIAKTGYCVVAVDQRGYGRTTGWDNRSWAQTDLSQWEFDSLVRDIVTFVWGIGYKKVHTIIGHDFGTIPSGWCALTRPDIFQSLFLMSDPFNLPTQPGFNLPSHSAPLARANQSAAQWPVAEQETQLQLLSPPRKNYQWYNTESGAAQDYVASKALGGLQNYFLVNTFLKSADFYLKSNNTLPLPHRLAGPDASALAAVPYFYTMLANMTLSENLALVYKGFNASVIKPWFPDSLINVYASEYSRNGFQGPLNYYRYLDSSPSVSSQLEYLWAGRSIQVPTFLLTGKYDWNVWFVYGSFENMPKVSQDYRGSVMLNASGHWPYIEQPNETVYYINKFIASINATTS